jgi:chemotaxis protein methyltransferase CheR
MSPWASAAMSHFEPVDDYAVFCAGVQQICQVDLAQYKRRQMERRVRSFAERNGTPRLSRYLAVLASDERERERFLERVTINVSQLWRNPEQWEMLAEHVIPELAQRDCIRAWSAGCSYGAEAYTLAAICREVAPDITLEILGSDIDERMIESARDAHFSESDARSAPAGALERWFERAPTGWRAGPQLRDAAHFEVGDLLVVKPPREAYDFIACRNTVIYFTAEGRSAVHAKLAGALRPGGYLMVGCTERISEPDADGLTLALPFTYRKN